MTRPKPLHTESTLLAAMETAGREGLEDEEARQALKDGGIGTPATRAAIIETLLKREYMVRGKKSLVPTEKGLALVVHRHLRAALVGRGDLLGAVSYTHLDVYKRQGATPSPKRTRRR